MFNFFKKMKINRLTKKIRAMQQTRISSQPTDDVVKKEINYYFELVNLFTHLKGNKKFPFADIMIIEALKAASSLDSANAHYKLSTIFLDEAQYRKKLMAEAIFNSPSNEQRCRQLFDEAHAHLLAAEHLGSIEGKRLRGLCIINGWGIEPDKNKGFELVVASIEQEGSWDRVPQIFASMGLNKPEFFSAIMHRRKEVS